MSNTTTIISKFGNAISRTETAVKEGFDSIGESVAVLSKTTNDILQTLHEAQPSGNGVEEDPRLLEAVEKLDGKLEAVLERIGVLESTGVDGGGKKRKMGTPLVNEKPDIAGPSKDLRTIIYQTFESTHGYKLSGPKPPSIKTFNPALHSLLETEEEDDDDDDMSPISNASPPPEKKIHFDYSHTIAQSQLNRRVLAYHVEVIKRVAGAAVVGGAKQVRDELDGGCVEAGVVSFFTTVHERFRREARLTKSVIEVQTMAKNRRGRRQKRKTSRSKTRIDFVQKSDTHSENLNLKSFASQFFVADAMSEELSSADEEKERVVFAHSPAWRARSLGKIVRGLDRQDRDKKKAAQPTRYHAPLLPHGSKLDLPTRIEGVPHKLPYGAYKEEWYQELSYADQKELEAVRDEWDWEQMAEDASGSSQSPV